MQKIVSYLGYLLGPGYPTSDRDQAPVVEKGQAPIGQRVPTREKEFGWCVSIFTAHWYTGSNLAEIILGKTASIQVRMNSTGILNSVKYTSKNCIT